MVEKFRTERVRQICRKLIPILGPKMNKIWLAYTLEDEIGKKEIEEMLEILAAQKIKDHLETEQTLLFPPSKERASGSYYIGEVFYNNKLLYPFGLREREWIQHLGIFGRSGAGKTNLGFSVVKELVRKNKPFVIFDWKRNYRDLLALPEFKDILIFTIGRDISPLKFNPLIPPKGTNPKIWLKKLVEIIAHAYFLGNGVIYLLQKSINAVYRKHAIYEGNTKYPNLHDVLNYLKNYQAKGREANWLSSTLRAISSLCFGEMGKLVNTKQNQTIENLLNKKVILELDALTQSDKIFFIEALLLWIHHYRLAENERERFKHAIIIEEAHHILNREKGSLIGGETIIETTFREIREFGEAIVVIDQHPSQISLPALGNTYCTICMNLKHKKDVDAIASSMLLYEEEKEYLSNLEIGEAIVRLQGRIQRPFLVKIPEFELEKGLIGDEKVRERMSTYFKIFQPFQSLNEHISAISKPDKEYREREEIREISYGEEQFLKDIVSFPLQGIVERYKRLKLNRRTGNTTKNNLIKKGYIEPVAIKTRKGRIVLFKLTDKAKVFLKEEGYEVREDRNGLEHRYWKEKVAEYYRKKGLKVYVEKKINGRPDIIVENGKKRVAIEIETGKSDAIGNIQKDMKEKFDMIICVATSDFVEKKMNDRLKEKGQQFQRQAKVILTNVNLFDFR